MFEELFGEGTSQFYEAVLHTVFGNVWAPRGIGFAAILVAVLYSVSATRARRIYERTVAIDHKGYYNYPPENPERARLAGRLEEALLDAAAAKSGVVFLWFGFAASMFAVQAHLLMLETAGPQNDELYSELFGTSPASDAISPAAYTYFMLTALFAIFALTGMIIWVCLHFKDGPDLTTSWLGDLVNPTAPGQAPSRPAQLCLRLGLIEPLAVPCENTEAATTP